MGYISWSHDDVVAFDSISAVHFHFFIIATQKQGHLYYSVPIAIIYMFTGNSSAWPWFEPFVKVTSSQSFTEFVCQNDSR